MTRKILLGGIAALALSAGTALPAMAQDYDDYNNYGTQQQYYDEDYTMPLRNLSDASDRINNVAVETPSGAYVGEVRSVRTNFQGEPSRIGIALRNGRWVWLDAQDARYDPSRNIVRSSLSYDQLEDMSI